MNTPIQTIYDYLDQAGLFGVWTGPDDTEQPPVQVQMRRLKEDSVDNEDRFLLIKQVSQGGGDRYSTTPVFVFAVFGKVNNSDAAYVETYAQLLYNAMLEFSCDGAILGVDPIGSPNGAYQMESGREVYDMEFVVKVEPGFILRGISTF